MKIVCLSILSFIMLSNNLCYGSESKKGWKFPVANAIGSLLTRKPTENLKGNKSAGDLKGWIHDIDVSTDTTGLKEKHEPVLASIKSSSHQPLKSTKKETTIELSLNPTVDTTKSPLQPNKISYENIPVATGQSNSNAEITLPNQPIVEKPLQEEQGKSFGHFVYLCCGGCLKQLNNSNDPEDHKKKNSVY